MIYMMRLKSLTYAILAILISVVVALSTYRQIEGGVIWGDALVNATVAYHLSQTGSMAFDEETPFYQREPIPIAILALYMRSYPGVMSDLDLTKTKQKENFESHKRLFYINIFYIAAMVLAIGWVCWLLTRSIVVYALVVAVSAKFFFWDSHHLDNLLTEYAAALFILLVAGFSVRVARNSGWYNVVLLGLALGMLSLTKASAHYVSIVYILLVPVILIYCNIIEKKRALVALLILVVSYASVVGPWILRNYLVFDDAVITTRGGSVLYVRALKNTMSKQEYIGSFYVYSPDPIKEVLERVFGYKRSDLAMEGAYGRLVRGHAADVKARASGNVEDITSFYYKASAFMRFRARQEMSASQYEYGSLDDYLVAKSLGMIMEDPKKHLLMSVPFAWRGLWPFAGFPLTFGIMLLSLLVGIYRRDSVNILYPLIAVGLFLFHATFSHFLPRYSVPLIPLSLISVGVAACYMAKGLRGMMKAYIQPNRN